MRFTLVPSLLLVFLSSLPVRAQTYPAEMVVTAPEVEVRSGPTKDYYPTSKLRMGERVVVVGGSKQPGWLAILPPSGSFSWINAKNVKQVNSFTGVIAPENGVAVPVMPGSSVWKKAPNVEGVKLQRGTQVVILDKAMTSESGAWLPIKPPQTEVRYIPADAVRPQAQFAGQVAPQNAAPTFPGGSGVNPLIRKADEAYMYGKIEEAKTLYKQAADSAADYHQRVYCYNRLASLIHGSWTPPPPAAKEQVAANAAKPAPVQTVGQTTAWTSPQAGRPAPGQTSAPQWSVWGVLRRAAFAKDGQPMYVLENKQGQPLLYVSTSAGTSLREFVGRTVSLYGAITYRSDDYMRMYHMIASHVAAQ